MKNIKYQLIVVTIVLLVMWSLSGVSPQNETAVIIVNPLTYQLHRVTEVKYGIGY